MMPSSSNISPPSPNRTTDHPSFSIRPIDSGSPHAHHAPSSSSSLGRSASGAHPSPAFYPLTSTSTAASKSSMKYSASPPRSDHMSAVDYARFAPPTASATNLSLSSNSTSTSNPPSRHGSGNSFVNESPVSHEEGSSSGEPNFAGRGAGRHSTNLGHGMALPPINTHFQSQPYLNNNNSHVQSPQQIDLNALVPRSASSSNGSPRMSFLSRTLAPHPPHNPSSSSTSASASSNSALPASAIPTPSAFAPSTSASSSSGGNIMTRPGRSSSISSTPYAARGLSTANPSSSSASSSARNRSPSSREPLFPPSKSNSNTSSASTTSQRSPTGPSHHAPFSSSASGSKAAGPSTAANHDHLPSSSESIPIPRSEKESGRERSSGQMCAKCDLPMTGQFVRALGTVYHLDCFRCMDCNKVVANKFFPIDSPDGNGKQVPLCETDYFRRLNLLCSKCGQALRGSYITALDMKFHVEHFTCSVCPTVFGPQDSYYEHAGSVYCHFHYSTRFAVKCTGCRTAILKQFVEINRNSVDEHWHPECYMINKFWNIKLAPSPPVKAIDSSGETSSPTPANEPAKVTESSSKATGPPSQALEKTEYLAQEEIENPTSLKARQKLMEEQVYRIWTVLSAFEESSAACISEMLRHVSSGHYIDGVQMAEKFVVHVETLFSAIDDLSAQFKSAGTKEISHVREARMLCKKVVNFFSLLSHTHETGARKMSITQELLSLVTGLAHYLKILIRIALTAALKLEREFNNRVAISRFLSKLDQLAHDPGASTRVSPNNSVDAHGSCDSRGASLDLLSADGQSLNAPKASNGATARTYGYKSLTRADGSTLVGQGEATTDLCEACHLTVEEECARFGTSHRWHLACLRCSSCKKSASRDRPTTAEELNENVWLPDYRLEVIGDGTLRIRGASTVCQDCARTTFKGETRAGFEYVTRLEQYAFLLCVALNKLYALLKQRGVVPSSPNEEDSSDDRSLCDTYRDSTDIKRMKSVNLDRKLSSTTARIPKRSVVVQSPSGRSAQTNDTTIPLFSGKPPVPSRKDQPLIDPVRGTTVPRPPPVPAQPNLLALSTSKPEEHITLSSATTTASSKTASSNATIVPVTPTALVRESPPSANSATGRPSLQRATTAIQIVDEQTVDASNHVLEPVLGGSREPTQDEDGITLADLPTVMEAEQKREQRRYQPTRPIIASGPLLSELSALEYLIVRHIAALLLTTESPNTAFSFRDIITLDELLEIIDERKNTFWGKLFKGGKKEKNEKKKGVFGIPIEVLVERNGADSMHGAGPGSLRIPSFVDDVISAMKQMDMSVEGIFRKNGNIRRLKELSEALDRDAASINLSDDNPVQIAALLKRFLRDLPDPLIPFKLFQIFIATQRIEDISERKRALHLACCLLPKSHRDTLEALFVFLKWVASFSHVDEETGSKMDLLNLATVVSPNILYSKGKDPARDESFSSVRAVHELLEWQEELWQVPFDFVSILNDHEFFSNPSQLTSKDILARADQHVRSAARKGSLPITYHQQPRGADQANGSFRPELLQTRSANSIPTGPSSRPMQQSSSNLASRDHSDRPMSYQGGGSYEAAVSIQASQQSMPQSSSVRSPAGNPAAYPLSGLHSTQQRTWPSHSFPEQG